MKDCQTKINSSEKDLGIWQILQTVRMKVHKNRADVSIGSMTRVYMVYITFFDCKFLSVIHCNVHQAFDTITTMFHMTRVCLYQRLKVFFPTPTWSKVCHTKITTSREIVNMGVTMVNKVNCAIRARFYKGH